MPPANKGSTFTVVGTSGIIYASLNVVELAFGGNPRSSLQTSATTTIRQTQSSSSQSQQAQSQSSSSSLLSNDSAASHLNVDVQGFVQGAAIVPEAAAVGVAISVPVGKPMSFTQTVNAAAAGAVSGGVFGWSAPAGQVVGYTAGRILTTVAGTGAIFAGLNVVELGFGGPQTASTSSSGIAGKTQQPSLSNQSQQAQSQSSSSSLLSNDTLVLYLNVARRICLGIRLQGRDIGRF